MPVQDVIQDAVVIGGGFYGAAIAIYLAKQRGFKNIILIERESALLCRASYNNQARVHNGYHYPRSFTTAYRSQVNFPKFVSDWPEAIKKDFTKIYAIARRNSKVTAKQFERFCKNIGAKIEPAEKAIHQLFEPRLIEAVFEVEEFALDTTKLAGWAEKELSEYGINILLNAQAKSISRAANNSNLKVTIDTRNENSLKISSQYVFNCTYSGLNQIRGDFPGTTVKLKQEITEIALIKPPVELQNLGVTVMDGPFFSIMPFPARNLHSLTHVRYTPHLYWQDDKNIDPYEKLKLYNPETRVDRMLRDVGRYLPVALDAKYIDSLFEIKTILSKTEGDDGRPILFEKHAELSGCYSILGGKLDNIYDILAKLDAETL